MTTKGLSERRSLQVIGMSASALRYQPRPDRNGALREKIVVLAQRHRRYGAAMIYLNTGLTFRVRRRVSLSIENGRQ
jgi:hypothetical protein